MRDSDVNLYRPERLREEFGPFVATDEHLGAAIAENDIVGETYRRVLAETVAIVAHQWRNDIRRSALKGFLFHGGVGIGKTTMGRRIAYELSRLFGEGGEAAEHTHEDGQRHVHAGGDDVVLVIVDGADIARGRYGDSEEQLRKLFSFAREGEFHGHRHEDDAERRTVLLFDDVESLFLERGSSGAKEWHFSQNSVFFHAIDELDTAHTVVVLTTNRIDLVDTAIVDRFLSYEFLVPPADVLTQVARHRASLQKLPEELLMPVLQAIAAPDSTVRSIREVERLVTRAYVASIVGATSGTVR
ncbi:MAG: family ATPase [Chloroflexi bacterium]|nr:family ATPase [Chloroflexota bacterium]